ncbi:hypothetical protein XENOCAPTIV_013917, partial [Xenoophorus captivus]
TTHSTVYTFSGLTCHEGAEVREHMQELLVGSNQLSQGLASGQIIGWIVGCVHIPQGVLGCQVLNFRDSGSHEDLELARLRCQPG